MPAQASKSHDNDRATLLGYLVAEQLLERICTGTWMSIAGRVESTRFWRTANGGDFDWSECAELGELSEDIAARVHTLSLVPDEELVKLARIDGRLDYSFPATLALHEFCRLYLTARKDNG